MSGKGKYRGGRNRSHGSGYHNQTLSSVARETAASLPADSPVLAMFKSAAKQLNERQDRHERLVKMSRDVTIESKRIIFLLHSAIRVDDSKKTLEEAWERLTKLIQGPIKAIGLELENSPAYLHSRAVSPGFQEFIEALTLCYMIEQRDLIPYEEVTKKLSYKIEEEGSEEKTIVTLLPRNDYFLGIADLTGELMRRAINSISSGDSEECFFACQVVRDLYTGFMGLYGTDKEVNRKLNTTRANVSKVENAVYALRVRGGEAPPTLLLSAPAPTEWESHAHHSDDEGYY